MDRDAIAGAQAIMRVQRGMTVYDAVGEKLGEVEAVQMGDPDAVTADQGQIQNDILKAVSSAILGREPEVTEPLRSRLLRTGYIKVDSPGIMAADRYVAADAIAAVTGNDVRLSVRRDRLSVEQ